MITPNTSLNTVSPLVAPLVAPRFDSLGERIELDAFRMEAIRRACDAGLFPAWTQRDVDWSAVLAWAERASDTDFEWRTEGVDPILLSAGHGNRVAIHSGQHRILGGLMAGNPVARRLCQNLSVVDPTRDWETPASAVWENLDLVALLR